MRLSPGSLVELCLLINNCTRLGIFSYSLESSIRDLDDVSHINSSSIRLYNASLELILALLVMYGILNLLFVEDLHFLRSGSITFGLWTDTWLLKMLRDSFVTALNCKHS